MRPRIFVGSSVKGLPVAQAIKKELEGEAEVRLWKEGIFKSTHAPIETLMTALNAYDFAVFVLLPEDPQQIRGRSKVGVRDNVLFELGLFLGRLGRERVFFVAPRGVSTPELNLPSDLSGITPASYDPRRNKLQCSVAEALDEFRNAIRGSMLFEGTAELKKSQFSFRNSYIFEGDKRVSEISQGELEFLSDGVIRLERRNKEGRFEIELRHNGPQAPSVTKRFALVERVFKVSFDARVDFGAHTLRCVFKNIATGGWDADKAVLVGTRAWKAYRLDMRTPASSDLLFRIDDLGPTVIPSRLYLRKLQIAEETR